MARSVRKIRRVDASHGADFDDQLWPINCALVILAGFVVGIVIRTSDFGADFGTERILYNGWARLISVGLLMGLLFWGVKMLQGKMARRLQLCVLISLTVHLWLAMYLHQQYWELLALEESDSARQVEELDDEAFSQIDLKQIEHVEEQQSFEEPIETEAPKPIQPEAIKRGAEEPEVPTTVDPPEQPEIPQRQQPSPAVMRRAELSAPRRADAAAGAQISRQEWKHAPNPSQPIPEEQVRPPARESAAAPRANIAPHQQRQTDVRINQRQTFEDFSSNEADSPRIAMARRASRREVMPDVPATPMPTRHVPHAAEIPRTEAAAPEPARTAERSQPPEPTPTPRGTARRQADAPTVVAPSAQPTPEPTAPRPVPRAVARQRRSEQTPRASEARRPSPRREVEMPSTPTATLAESTMATGLQAEASPESEVPVVRVSAMPVNQGADRAVEIKQSQPAGRALPTVSRVVQLPSALAGRRSNASRQDPAGSETSPARPSSLARSSQGANLPSSAVLAEGSPASIPASTGGTRPSRLKTAATAAVRREAADPAAGSSRAMAGTADFAVGSAQIVARIGQPRGAGIGQPSAAANATARRIARAAGTAPSTAASGVAQAAPAASGSAALAARGPSIPSFNMQGSAARRGGTVSDPVTRTATGSGPAGSGGAPETVGVSTANRVARYEPVDAAISGSGTPKPGRRTGGAPSPSATAVVSATASEAPTGGTAMQAPPLQAQLSGARRQVTGMPGGLESQPAAGALASLVDEGAPLANAVARRSAASGTEPGGHDLAARESVTLRRTRRGTDLPTPAVPVENPVESGASGVAVTDGGQPSTLPTGVHATVRQAAAEVAVAQVTATAGSSDSSHGSATAVAMAGRVWTSGEGVPVLTAEAAAPRRSPPRAASSPLAGSPVADLASTGPQPATEAAAGETNSGPLASVEADWTGSDRRMAGLPGDLIEAVTVEVAVESGPMAGTASTVRGQRRLPRGDDPPGPSLAAEVGRGPLRRTDVAGLPRGVAEVTDQQPITSTASDEPGEMIDVAEGPDPGEPSRREGGLPVQIAAVAGPGGLGYDLSPEVGLPSRLARPESEIVHTVSRRFVLRSSGGELAIDGRVREQPTKAFLQRDIGRRAQAAQVWGGSEGTEKAVEMGLDYFARSQFPDGHWSLHELPPGDQRDDPALGEMKSDTAATGLALLTYLGAGYTHWDDKHRTVVRRGLDWLVAHQKDNGDLFTGGTKYAWFYSHGIATIALCEGYGMTRDPELREPARKAIEFILKTQHPTRGGWRYFVDARGVSTETDTSVTGWMLMALKSAHMAELDVPDEALARIDDWTETAAAPRADGQYVYNPFAGNTASQRHGRRPSLAMTAEAMLMRMYLGRGRDDPGLIAGADHLKENLPAIGNEGDDLRDCYYWYYATQVMFQMRGDYWKAWNDRLHPMLQESQVQTGVHAGSWHPLYYRPKGRPAKDKWGVQGGRHYVTALRLLILEVYYRHLPLFDELGK